MEEVSKRWIQEALFILFNTEDNKLIERKVKEECINHRLAAILENCKPKKYREYFIDVEYNKLGDEEKMIEMSGNQVVIRPDIVVHKRSTNITENALAIECKIGYLRKHDKEKLIKMLVGKYSYTDVIGISYQSKKDYFLLYIKERDFCEPLKVKKSSCIITET